VGREMKTPFPLLIGILALAVSVPHSALAQPKSNLPVSKYRELLTDYGWYIGGGKQGDKPNKYYLSFDPNGTFSYQSFTPHKIDSGKWKLEGDQLTLTFKGGKTQKSTIKFLSRQLVLQDGKEYWHPELS
jgi:hypothetical protein